MLLIEQRSLIVTSNWRGGYGEFTGNLVAKAPLDTQADPGANEGHNSIGLPMSIGSTMRKS